MILLWGLCNCLSVVMWEGLKFLWIWNCVPLNLWTVETFHSTTLLIEFVLTGLEASSVPSLCTVPSETWIMYPKEFLFSFCEISPRENCVCVRTINQPLCRLCHPYSTSWWYTCFFLLYICFCFFKLPFFFFLSRLHAKMEPRVGLELTTLWSTPELKFKNWTLKPLSHSGPPDRFLLLFFPKIIGCPLWSM